jgi:hypothetical protein
MAKVKFNIGGVVTEMEAEEVSKAIEAGEVIITNDNLVVYKKEDFESFKTNYGTEEYKKGKTAGEEMLIKEGREKLGLEFQGKTFDNFAEAFKTKVLTEAKIEPTKKIQELEEEKKKLQGNYTTLEQEFNGFKTSVTEKETRQKKDNTLLSFIPTTGLIIDTDLALMALKQRSGIDVTFGENNLPIITKNGVEVKDDKLMSHVDPKAFVLNEITSLKLLKSVEGGGGGTDENKGGTASNYDKFVKEMTDKGVNEGSMAFGEEMNARVKAGTLKM